MIGWLIKKLATANTATPSRVSVQRTTSPENCMLWRDVERALDAKPRTNK